MEISIGVVTNLSISSALRPFHYETIMICVLVTSGKASMGIFLKATNPEIININTQKKVKYLFFSEKAMIPFIILLIIETAKIDLVKILGYRY
jgi:hypothetical protein